MLSPAAEIAGLPIGRSTVGAVVVATNFGIATGAYIDERDDWDAAVARATAEGWAFVELTAISEERLDALCSLLNRTPDVGTRFARISIHAPVVFLTSAAVVVERLAR